MEAVVRVLPRENVSLELWFNTGNHRLFDARPYLNRGVFTRLQDIDLFNQAFVAKALVGADAEWGDGAGAFPLSEAIHREVLSLPMGPQLTEAQQQSVVSVLNHR